MIIYLDSSMIVKRYIQEEGTPFSDFLFEQAGQGYLTIAYNLLNIGEVLGVFDQYLRRNWVEQETFNKMMTKFVDETLRLLRINRLVIVPTLSSLQMNAWSIVLQNRLYIVDAIQISSSNSLEANYFCSGDKDVTTVAKGLGMEVYTPDNEPTLIQRIKNELT